MNCNFCEKSFTNLSSLNHHKKTAKFCLNIQTGIKEKEKEYKCNFCNKILISKQSQNNHFLICKLMIIENESQKILKDKEYEFQKILKDKEYEFQKILKDKDIIIDKLEFVRDSYMLQIKEQCQANKDLLGQLNNLALKAIEKPTSTTNMVVNKLDLNAFITHENIEDKVQRKFNDNYVSNGLKDIAKFVYEWILKTEKGDLIYACYDRSRLVFKYRDNCGNELKDPKAIQLANMLKPSLIKKLKEMLVYFTEEFDYINSRKERLLEYDQKEYNTFKNLKEKALELGFELTSMTETNTFCNELAKIANI